MKNISYKVDQWINKNKSKFTIPSQTRDYINAQNIFAEGSDGVLHYGEFKEFLATSKISELAGMKMLFDAMSNEHFIKMIDIEEIDGKSLLHILEFTPTQERSYSTRYLPYIEQIILLYMECRLEVNIDFDEFYELIMK